MKKLVLAFLSILVLTGVVYAAAISQSIDAKTQTETWLISVYNNSGSEMDVGDVAIWDIADSTGDNDNYVQSSATADTFLVAGVVFPNAIAAEDVGTIIVKGTAAVDLITSGSYLPVEAGCSLCTSATDGSAQICSDATTDPNSFGFCTSAPSGGSCTAYINVR